MNFGLSDDQRTIKATARELLASRSPFERVRAAAEAGRYDALLGNGSAHRIALARGAAAAARSGAAGAGERRALRRGPDRRSTPVAAAFRRLDRR